MVTIDLGTPPAAPVSTLDGLPRRLPLTLTELRLAAEMAGGAPLPFEMATATTTSLEDRLGHTRGSAEEAAYDAAHDALHEPAGSLERRRLMVDGRLEPGLAGAIGLLATPDVAVDLDVVVEGVQVKSWHRQSALGVATLSTADGLVFEIAWMPASQWGDELRAGGRAPARPADDGERGPADRRPAVRAARRRRRGAPQRPRRPGPRARRPPRRRRGPSGRPLPDADVAGLLQTLSRETRGRLRALVAHVGDGPPTVVGVVSWLLLSDGWHSLETHTDTESDTPLVRLRAVEASELGGALAPVIAEVTT